MPESREGSTVLRDDIDPATCSLKMPPIMQNIDEAIQESRIRRAGERGTTWAGEKEKEWTDCVVENRRVFGITRNWSTTSLDPGVWCSTVMRRELQACNMAAEGREQENASKN